MKTLSSKVVFRSLQNTWGAYKKSTVKCFARHEYIKVELTREEFFDLKLWTESKIVKRFGWRNMNFLALKAPEKVLTIRNAVDRLIDILPQQRVWNRRNSGLKNAFLRPNPKVARARFLILSKDYVIADGNHRAMELARYLLLREKYKCKIKCFMIVE